MIYGPCTTRDYGAEMLPFITIIIHITITYPHYLLLPLLTQAFATEIIQMGKTIKYRTAPCNSLSATRVPAKPFRCDDPFAGC